MEFIYNKYLKENLELNIITTPISEIYIFLYEETY